MNGRQQVQRWNGTLAKNIVCPRAAWYSQLTPVTSKELGNGLPILQAICPSKDGVEALVVVHIGAGDGASCLPCVQSMALQQPHHTCMFYGSNFKFILKPVG